MENNDQCEHLKQELCLKGTTEAHYVLCCELTHGFCSEIPQECFYKQLYEKGLLDEYKKSLILKTHK